MSAPTHKSSNSLLAILCLRSHYMCHHVWILMILPPIPKPPAQVSQTLLIPQAAVFHHYATHKTSLVLSGLLVPGFLLLILKMKCALSDIMCYVHIENFIPRIKFHRDSPSKLNFINIVFLSYKASNVISMYGHLCNATEIQLMRAHGNYFPLSSVVSWNKDEYSRFWNWTFFSSRITYSRSHDNTLKAHFLFLLYFHESFQTDFQMSFNKRLWNICLEKKTLKPAQKL